MDFWTLAQTFGLPVAFLMLALLTNQQGRWQFQGQIERLIAEIRLRYEERHADCREELARARVEAEAWRRAALRATEIGDFVLRRADPAALQPGGDS